MLDSVSELRKKIEYPFSAAQDGTINAVVTLAAIEHGKGNYESSAMHVSGVKEMIRMRGGISQVKHTSPLTARMVLWVSMLVTRQPQFGINDHVEGHGISPDLQWQLASANLDPGSFGICCREIDPSVRDVLARLRHIFHHGKVTITTELHDLTCFVIHKLLSPLESSCDGIQEYNHAVSLSLRHALVLYLLIIRRTTYYSHAHMAALLAKRLRGHLQDLPPHDGGLDSMKIWAISMGMVSSLDLIDRQFASEARSARSSSGLSCWNHVLTHLESILWLNIQQDNLFLSGWQEILTNTNR
ncbi:uncharacterized protein MAM_04438 [Metarhizium album ARSEF 1941]|uniref:Uncharacterized protein n=1 Tax=Metarhizium album (strain ARSEF 1941) TaxID=1081103 RepID=A0A0B2WTP5_METAS|nr:uncharacterized protein MAM_04438 [Metarhizium album ARSEF 1941]KHN97423.1 hypothetical protein MAM_04438 [Metarhizium album ARSEF 1941]